MKKQTKLVLALLIGLPVSLLTSCSDDPKPTEEVVEVVEEKKESVKEESEDMDMGDLFDL